MKAIVILLLLTSAGRLAAQATPTSTDTLARRLSLGQALELAEQRSEAVGLARSDVARNEGLRRQARSGYFPQLSGCAGSGITTVAQRPKKITCSWTIRSAAKE